ncbi:uncharacterized protein PF3D7_1120600-like [Centruroides vittatus]|uniref:uncharacterized protein PF3D7_1120600-like n=1 Tax=Centruroides vittatus TaxID=120091 RepID=UPI0035108745
MKENKKRSFCNGENVEESNFENIRGEQSCEKCGSTSKGSSLKSKQCQGCRTKSGSSKKICRIKRPVKIKRNTNQNDLSANNSLKSFTVQLEKDGKRTITMNQTNDNVKKLPYTNEMELSDNLTSEVSSNVNTVEDKNCLNSLSCHDELTVTCNNFINDDCVSSENLTSNANFVDFSTDNCLHIDEIQDNNSFLENVIYEIPLQHNPTSFKCTESCFRYLAQINLRKLLDFINEVKRTSHEIPSTPDKSISLFENSYNSHTKSRTNTLSENFDCNNLHTFEIENSCSSLKQMNSFTNDLTDNISPELSQKSVDYISNLKDPDDEFCISRELYFQEDKDTEESSESDNQINILKNTVYTQQKNEDFVVEINNRENDQLPETQSLERSVSESSIDIVKDESYDSVSNNLLENENATDLISRNNLSQSSANNETYINENESLKKNLDTEFLYKVRNDENEVCSSNIQQNDKEAVSFRKFLPSSDLQNSNDKFSLQNSYYSPETLDYEPEECFSSPVKTLDFTNDILNNEISPNGNQTEKKVDGSAVQNNWVNDSPSNQEAQNSESYQLETKNKQSPPTPVLDCVVDEDDEEILSICETHSSEDVSSDIEDPLEETNNLNETKDVHNKKTENLNNEKKEFIRGYCYYFISKGRCFNPNCRYIHDIPEDNKNDTDGNSSKGNSSKKISGVSREKVQDSHPSPKNNCRQNSIKYDWACQRYSDEEVLRYITEDRWGFLTALFNNCYGDGHFANLVKYAFCKQADFGLKFKAFVRLATMNGKQELKKEQIFLLGAIGSSLILEAYKSHSYNTVYTIVETLHNFDINYYYLQHINRNPCIPPWSIVTPSWIALVAINSCLQLNKLSVALQILDACDWAMPSPELLPDIRRKEISVRLNILTHLGKLWLSKNLNTSVKILNRILKSIDNDLYNKEEIKSISGIEDFYNGCIENLLQNQNFGLLFPLYDYYWKLNSHLELKPSLLRAAIIIYIEKKRNQQAQSLLTFMISKGIYQPPFSTFPNCIYIQNDWTKEEIRLMVDYCLHELCIVLHNIKDNKYTYQNLFSLNIILQKTTNIQDNISKKYFPILPFKIVLMQVIDVLKTLPVSLDGEKKSENKFTVRPGSFHNYFQTWHLKNYGTKKNIVSKKANFTTSTANRLLPANNPGLLLSADDKEVETYISNVRHKTDLSFSSLLDTDEDEQNYQFSERQEMHNSSSNNVLKNHASGVSFNKYGELPSDDIYNTNELNDNRVKNHQKCNLSFFSKQHNVSDKIENNMMQKSLKNTCSKKVILNNRNSPIEENVHKMSHPSTSTANNYSDESSSANIFCLNLSPNMDSTSNLSKKQKTRNQKYFRNCNNKFKKNIKSKNNHQFKWTKRKRQGELLGSSSERKQEVYEKKDSFCDTVSYNKIYSFIKSQLLRQEKEIFLEKDLEEETQELTVRFMEETFNENNDRRELDKKDMKELDAFCKRYINERM